MIIDLVDSIEYTTTNCFAHQLHRCMHEIPGVKTVALADIASHPRPDAIVCRLKQRTLHRVINQLQEWCGDTPMTIFDQDPWQAYMDDSPYKGVYQRAAAKLNIKAIAVTTRHWAERISYDKLPGLFTSMWVLPEYCESGLPFEDRAIQVGFIGSLHPYRRKLFDKLENMDVSVNVMGGSALPYDEYLRALSNIRVFIHSEDSPIVIDGQHANLKDALWIKDVEAAARGCFTIRNSGEDSESYYDGIETVRLYDDPKEIPGLLRDIERMDPQERQATVDRSVEFIRRSNKWHETASTLLSMSKSTSETVT